VTEDVRQLLAAIAAASFLAGGSAFIAWDTRCEVDAVSAANHSLDDEVAGLQREIAQGPELAARLDACNASFKDYVKILPSPEVATEEKLLRTVSVYCDLAQIRMSEVLCGAAQQRTAAHGGDFQEVGVSFRIASDYDAFVRFLNLLERHESFIKVNAFSVTPAAQRSLELDASIELTTYTYLPKK
jgi:hypothetical protein